jgi:hypothetical protein
MNRKEKENQNVKNAGLKALMSKEKSNLIFTFM